MYVQYNNCFIFCKKSDTRKGIRELICPILTICTQLTSQPPRNLPYSTFLPTSHQGTLQSLTINQNGAPVAQRAHSQTLPSNRLSYLGTNETPTELANSNIVNIPSPSINLSPNGVNSSPYGVIHNSSTVNPNPSGISFNQAGPNRVEQMRSSTHVNSYISALNNPVSCQIKLVISSYRCFNSAFSVSLNMIMHLLFSCDQCRHQHQVHHPAIWFAYRKSQN